MSNLNWLTPKDIYLYYLNEEDLLPDGRSVRELIDEWQDRLAYENSLFERTGAREADRWTYERIATSIQAALSKTEARVSELMMQQGESGHWIAFGRQHPDAEEQAIPFRHLPFLSLDIEKRIATGDHMTFRAVRCLIRRQIPNGHPILGQIREAQRLPETAARSAEMAQAQTPGISATPVPDPARMHHNVPDCLSRPTKIENTVPKKWLSRMSFVKEEFRRPGHHKARTKWAEAEVLATWFEGNFSTEVALPAKAIRNWLYSPEGRIAWDEKSSGQVEARLGI